MEYKVCSEKKYVLYQHIPKVLTSDLLGVGVGVGVTPTPAKTLDLKTPTLTSIKDTHLHGTYM